MSRNIIFILRLCLGRIIHIDLAFPSRKDNLGKDTSIVIFCATHLTLCYNKTKQFHNDTILEVTLQEVKCVCFHCGLPFKGAVSRAAILPFFWIPHFSFKANTFLFPKKICAEVPTTTNRWRHNLSRWIQDSGWLSTKHTESKYHCIPISYLCSDCLFLYFVTSK